MDIDALSMKPTPWIYNLHILQGHSFVLHFLIFMENLDNENCFQSSHRAMCILLYQGCNIRRLHQSTYWTKIRMQKTGDVKGIVVDELWWIVVDEFLDVKRFTRKIFWYHGLIHQDLETSMPLITEWKGQTKMIFN